MCVFAEACVRVSLPVDAAEGCQLFEFFKVFTAVGSGHKPVGFT
jgi:hypothetical protein